MTQQAVGILPFGSSDTSAILQCTLKTLAEVQANGGAERNVGKCTFDTIKGVSANATNGGVVFTTPAGYAALDFAGQVSFEIETAGVSVINSSILSSGTDQTGNVYFFVMSDAGGSNYLRMMMDANERIFIGWTTGGVAGGTSPSSSSVQITSFGKAQFCRVTISWIGNQYDLYIDGNWLFTGNRNGIPAGNIGAKINISASGGLGNAMVNIYARNLIVSTKPVYRAIHPAIRKLAVVGHSFATRAKMWDYSQAYRDRSIGLAIRTRLEARGISAGMPNDSSLVFGSSGATILRSVGNPIQTQVDLCVAQNVDAVVYLGGTNDVLRASWSTDRAQVLADLKSDLTDLLGAANTTRVVLPNVPSTYANSANFASSNSDANVGDINADFSTIPAWWDANNPTRTGAIIVVDQYRISGGTPPRADWFWGTALGNHADLHPSSVGGWELGTAIADALLSSLK